MPPLPRSVPPDEVERLARIRVEAAAERAAVQAAIAERVVAEQDKASARGPDPQADILGAIAWRWAAVGESPQLVGAIEAAQLDPHRRSWKEIAAACGVDPADEAAVAAFAVSRRRRR